MSLAPPSQGTLGVSAGTHCNGSLGAEGPSLQLGLRSSRGMLQSISVGHRNVSTGASSP